MMTFTTSLIKTNAFTNQYSIIDQSGEKQEVKGYKNIAYIFLKMFCSIKDIKDSSGKVIHITKSQYNKLMSGPKNHTKVSHVASSSSSSSKRGELLINSPQAKKQLKKQGTDLTFDRNITENIAIDKKVLSRLPKGSFYVMHNKLDDQDLFEFRTSNPGGEIIVFCKTTHYNLSSKVQDFAIGSTERIPVCTLFFPPSPEVNKQNLKNIKSFIGEDSTGGGW